MSESKRWSRAWLMLTLAFALHAIDEATHDFLAWFNPIAAAIRSRLGVSFPPFFTFGGWLAGLTVAIVLLALATPLVRPRRRWMIGPAYAYAGIHVLNGVAHILVAIAGRWVAPGVISAPVVLLAALWLFLETWRVQHRLTEAAASDPNAAAPSMPTTPVSPG